MHSTTVLIIDGNRDNVQQLTQSLSANGRGGYEVLSAESLTEAKDYLSDDILKTHIDLILLNPTLSDSHGMNTFREIRSFVPELPLIVISGADDENLSLEILRDGGQDFLVLEDIVPGHLMRTIRLALERNRIRIDKDQYITKLQNSLVSLKDNPELLSMCSSCKKIRDYQGNWVDVDVYLTTYSEIKLSHSYCPDCFDEQVALNESYSQSSR